MKKYIPPVLSIVILVAILYICLPKGSKPKIASPVQQTDQQIASISSAELAKHNNKNNCWIAINTLVYDVTNYIINHPGGDRILSGCGKDATKMFNGELGSDHIHSDRARQLLSTYKIGNFTK